LQIVILVPPEFGKPLSTPPLPIQNLKSEDHCYNKWTRVCLHQDTYLKIEKQKTATHPYSHKKLVVPNRFKITPKPQRIIGSVTG